MAGRAWLVGDEVMNGVEGKEIWCGGVMDGFVSQCSIIRSQTEFFCSDILFNGFLSTMTLPQFFFVPQYLITSDAKLDTFFFFFFFFIPQQRGQGLRCKGQQEYTGG